MTNQAVITKTAKFIEKKFSGEATGHDWSHMYRVWQLAKRIGLAEGNVDMSVVELGALLHDIADWKFNDDEEAGPREARQWLESQNVDETTIQQIEDIIRNVSFKGAHVQNKLSKEGQVIYDADKLDAIGAIGIARAFAYGGANNRPMYVPQRKVVLHKTFEHYKKDRSGTLNHFYEKLLLLKDRMYTETGKQLAQHRHDVLQQFVDEFLSEWNGKS